MKKNRIRIHKVTLDLLGKPKNKHILINPTEYNIIIRTTPPDTKDSLTISYKADSDCEFYSTDLMKQLSLLKPQLKKTCTYRILGETVNERRIVLFDINNATIVDGSVGNESKKNKECPK